MNTDRLPEDHEVQIIRDLIMPEPLITDSAPQKLDSKQIEIATNNTWIEQFVSRFVEWAKGVYVS